MRKNVCRAGIEPALGEPKTELKSVALTTRPTTHT